MKEIDEALRLLSPVNDIEHIKKNEEIYLHPTIVRNVIILLEQAKEKLNGTADIRTDKAEGSGKFLKANDSERSTQTPYFFSEGEI